MNKTQFKILVEKIDTEIITTKNKIKEYTELCQPIAPENSIGRVSRMDAINNKSIVEAALRVAKQKIHKLEIIKTKIKDTNFGICNRCKKPIPFERMIIQPHSNLCVHCAK